MMICPTPSMGLAYLPTLMVDVCGFQVDKYGIHGWYGYIILCLYNCIQYTLNGNLPVSTSFWGMVSPNNELGSISSRCIY